MFIDCFLLQVNSMTTIYAAAATAAINYGPDPLQGARPAVGYAKVRIWRTNLPDRAGHVSLETDESYISIWPNSGLQILLKRQSLLVVLLLLSMHQH